MLQVRNPSTGVVSSVPSVKGVDGKSAYQYALTGGYTGTEEEFAESLAYDAKKEIDKINEKLVPISDEDVLNALIEIDALSAIMDDNGAIFADENNNILMW